MQRLIRNSYAMPRLSALALNVAEIAFIEEAETSLWNLEDSDRERLMNLAEKNSWQNRVDNIAAVILDRVSKNKSEADAREQHNSRSSRQF